MRLFLLPLLGLGVLLLSSCFIDGNEEVWIHKDGSGRLEATYEMHPSVMRRLGGAEQLRKKLEEAIAKDPTLTATAIDHRVEPGRVVFHFAAEFEDLRELAKFPQRHLRDSSEPGKTVPEEALFGKIQLRLNGLVLSLYREVDLAPILPEAAKNNPGLLGNSTFRYTFHLPVAATENDAHEVRNKGKTLTWSFLLREHTTEPMAIYAKARLPLPWWIWLSLVLLIVLFVLLLIWAAKYTMALRS